MKSKLSSCDQRSEGLYQLVIIYSCLGINQPNLVVKPSVAKIAKIVSLPFPFSSFLNDPVIVAHAVFVVGVTMDFRLNFEFRARNTCHYIN